MDKLNTTFFDDHGDKITPSSSYDFISHSIQQLNAVIEFDSDAAPAIIAAVKGMRDCDYDALMKKCNRTTHEKHLHTLSEEIVAQPAFALAILESLELFEISTLQHFRKFAEKVVRVKKQESLLTIIKRQATKRMTSDE